MVAAWATIEAGYMQLEIGGFDISGMLASLLTLTHQRLRTENVSLNFDCPNDLGEMVGDERRIKQVIFQLLSNAIKFTPTGGTVTLEAARDADTVSITVIDTGAGIDMADQSHISTSSGAARARRSRRRVPASACPW